MTQIVMIVAAVSNKISVLIIKNLCYQRSNVF
jgi:hypothetical protein